MSIAKVSSSDHPKTLTEQVLSKLPTLDAEYSKLKAVKQFASEEKFLDLTKKVNLP